MRTDGKTEIQHYVPKFLLRPHANNLEAGVGREQIWCFDKKLGKIISPNIKGIASGKGFYDLSIDDKSVSLENFVTMIEDLAAPIIAKIINEFSINWLNKKERAKLADFCAVQMVRTQFKRDDFRLTSEKMREALAKITVDGARIPKIPKQSDEAEKLASLKIVLDAPGRFARYFLEKHWCLLPATTDTPFYIGDDPIVRASDAPSPGRGFGIASPGVSIYLPLGPTLCLVMTDARLIREIEQNYRKYRIFLAKNAKRERKIDNKTGIEASQSEMEKIRYAEDVYQKHIRDVIHKKLAKYDPRFVEYANSLQVAYSARWIMSSTQNFSLAIDMLNDDPRLRLPAFTIVA